MTRATIGGLALSAISITLGGCAAPPIADGVTTSALTRDKAASSKHPKTTREAETTGNGDDDDDDRAGGGDVTSSRRTAAAAAPSAPTAPPAQVSVTFLGSKNQAFDGMPIGRACSDRGANLQNATFLDGTSFRIISVDYPDKVLAHVSGAELDAMKQRMIATGDFVVPVDPKLLPSSPYEFAIIMAGDDRFGSPEACGVSLKPHSSEERDARNFPNDDTMIFNGKVGGTGCGTVGYFSAYYDATQQKVIAQATSQFLLAAWDGEAGFPEMYDRTPCDVNHSPLVVDLDDRGVRLRAPTADVFDIDGDGKRDAIPWVVSELTPFLVRDANDNGVVDGIDEMFGNRTRDRLGGGRTSLNGFEALAPWDQTCDGAVDARDPVWASLRLWFDRDHDGRTDPGELETLEARGVRSLALGYVRVREELYAGGKIQGAVRQRSGATMTDGRVVNVVDVWFDGHF